MQTHANEAMHDGGSRGWSPWCTCIVVTTCCSGVLPFNCQCLVMGRGSTQEPPSQFYFFTVATICIFAETMSPMYFAHFAETTSPIVFWFFRQYHVANVFWWRFWTWRPCRRTSIIWRCIVDFFVSYLICMFQDSVPAGSLKWSILV